MLGSNGSGKSHFLRLLAGERRSRTRASGSSARASCPGTSRRRTPTRSCWAARSSTSCGPSTPRTGARRCRVLRRYELERQGDQPFERLSGGQQARFQILLLELAGTTALLLDEPTDNLDLESAEALQEGLEAYDGHGAGGHPRPLVRAVLRPLPGLRRGRRGAGDGGAGVGRGAGWSGRGDLWAVGAGGGPPRPRRLPEARAPPRTLGCGASRRWVLSGAAPRTPAGCLGAAGLRAAGPRAGALPLGRVGRRGSAVWSASRRLRSGPAPGHRKAAPGALRAPAVPGPGAATGCHAPYRGTLSLDGCGNRPGRRRAF